MKIFSYRTPILDENYLRGCGIVSRVITNEIIDYYQYEIGNRYQIVSKNRLTEFLDWLSDDKENRPVSLYADYDEMLVQFTRTSIDEFHKEIYYYIEDNYADLLIDFPKKRKIQLLSNVDLSVEWYRKFPSFSGFTKNQFVVKKASSILSEKGIIVSGNLYDRSFVGRVFDLLFVEGGNFYYHYDPGEHLILSRCKESELLGHMDQAVEVAESEL